MITEPKISIIGGGLSAIYAYWGCLDAGYYPHEVQVLYNTRTVPMGAVFMYDSPIFWPPRKVTSVLLGTCDQYSINQWDDIRKTSAHIRFRNGETPTITEKLYLPEEMMVTLWGLIPRKAESPLLTDENISDIKAKRDAVICTFANKAKRQHYLERGYLGGFPIHVAEYAGHDSVVLYNGLKTVPWVRQTVIPGKIYTEYANITDHTGIMRYESERGNIGGNIIWSPDLHPDCPALEWEERIEGNLFRVGRFSCFTPGYLSHIVRQETEKFLCDL